MDRRTFIRLTIGAGGALVLTACDGDDGRAPTSVSTPPGVDEPAPRPTLRLASPEIGFPSPYVYGPGTHSLVLYIYDTLVVRDAQGGLREWLAARFERSADGLSHAFELREDARWHDGEPVTAEDVAFSFDYFAAHADELPPTVLFRPDGVVSEVVVTGERSGEIRLSEPWVAFGSEVGARFPIVPRHVWADIDAPAEITEPGKLVGSGPYRLVELDLQRGAYRFEANDDHWLGAPFVERVEMSQVSDPLMALRSGEIDAAESALATPTREVLPVFTDDPRFGVAEGDPDFFAALSWNAAADGAPGNRDFRHACAHAIDRDELVERLLGDGAPGHPGYLPPHHRHHHSDVPTYPYDPEEAERLLQEAGYARDDDGVRRTSDGQPLAVTMLTLPQLAAAAELVREALGRVGIEVEFDPTDLETAMMTGAFDDYEMALIAFGGLERDADQLREVFSSDTAGEHIFHALGWANEEFDELATAQAVNLDEDGRAEQLARMQELIATDLPLLQLYYAPAYLMYRREVFTEWSLEVEAKQILVTGKANGEPPIRPIDGSGMRGGDGP